MPGGLTRAQVEQEHRTLRELTRIVSILAKACRCGAVVPDLRTRVQLLATRLRAHFAAEIAALPDLRWGLKGAGGTTTEQHVGRHDVLVGAIEAAGSSGLSDYERAQMVLPALIGIEEHMAEEVADWDAADA